MYEWHAFTYKDIWFSLAFSQALYTMVQMTQYILKILGYLLPSKCFTPVRGWRLNIDTRCWRCFKYLPRILCWLDNKPWMVFTLYNGAIIFNTTAGQLMRCCAVNKDELHSTLSASYYLMTEYDLKDVCATALELN